MLVDQIRACRRCPVPAASHPIVPDHARQKFLLIGQAPGKEELIKNRPFAGAAGRNLFRWFADAGLGSEATVRATMHFASLARCWPGTKTGSKDDLPPSSAMRHACRGFLEAEAVLLDPDWLVAVGAMAAREVLGVSGSLEEWVGPVHAPLWYGRERKMIVLPHPSGLSRWLNDPAHKASHNRALSMLAAAWPDATKKKRREKA